ncbi:MAG: hypothetical protein KDB94_08455 [Acidobacteria bacterium]|nr:hypothetical protein [Acidobacteriota bacterium]
MSKSTLRTLVVLLPLAAFAALPARAQSATPTPAPAPPPCSAAEFRQFDFWLGDWEVEAGGKLAGHNRITRLYGDCILREEYRTANGAYVGTSLNGYDAARKVWHQTWVDNQGLVLLLDGRFEKGAMRLEGKSPTAGGERIDRITWTPNPDGSVRQHWEQSTDGGKSWKSAFDGLYRKKK